MFTSIRNHCTLATRGACWHATPSARQIAAEMARAFRGPPRGHRQHPAKSPLVWISRWQTSDTNFPDIPSQKARRRCPFCANAQDEGFQAAVTQRLIHARPARLQVERELAMIEKLKLAGYFLIVWDIVRFCGTRYPGAGTRQRRQ